MITAADLLALARARADRPVVLVDGFSGAGKTTLADELRRADPAVTVQSIEEFYLGWDGLAAGPRRAFEQLVAPLLRGEVPVVAVWDWRRDEIAPSRRRVVPGPLVLEGVGAAARPLRDVAALSVWVDATPAEREARLHARGDWADYAPHRAAFERQERDLEARQGTRAAVDVIVRRDGREWVRCPV
ncbi:uridine kinase family protein [Actinomycetospora termitidis]|uniref:Uridine kinase n=1 Tax=Actinomycetospora termitidis TaxID=3053470 RepID=A0ABT7M2T2_9PSEU|nr:hypothetical protein [Actinomycetospora sp. Odt1-22]MDL5154972.1 hypothetical protein [Actinomycetospora sp. Odt1-22]